ncbi:MAG: hypothetical protein AB7P99_15455 [Vicinamibacterales bacterium]
MSKSGATGKTKQFCVGLPTPLRECIEDKQETIRAEEGPISLGSTIRRLLVTHPEIVEIARRRDAAAAQA